MIAIIDYGMGNTGAIKNMLRRIGYADVKITNDKEDICKAEKLILPGVGSFNAAMQMIHEQTLKPILDEQVLKNKKTILGICLGMQLLTKGSEEGNAMGFGWIDAYTYKFNTSLKVPHMGWQTVLPQKQHPLINNLQDSKFYFVHSYYVKCNNEQNELLTCNYETDFTCAVQQDNILGVQFHPEKSHKYGMQFMKNFVEL